MKSINFFIKISPRDKNISERIDEKKKGPLSTKTFVMSPL